MAEREVKVHVSAVDKASATIKKMAGQIGADFDSIKSLLPTIAVAAFVGKSIKDFANLGEEIGKLKVTTGLSAGALSGLKKVADESGISLDSFAGASKKLQLNIAGMGSDVKGANAALKPLGITFEQLKSQTPDQQLDSMAKAIAGVKDQADKTALSAQFLGKAGIEILPAFENGAKGLDQFAQEAKDAGVFMDEISLKKAQALDDAMDKVGTAFKGIAQNIAILIAPIITLLATLISWISEKLVAAVQFLQMIWDSNWGGIQDKTKAVIDFLKNMFGEFMTWWNDFWAEYGEVIKLGWDAVVAIFGLAWDALKLGFGLLWESLKLIFTTAWEVLKGAIKLAIAIFTGDWAAAWEAIKGIFTGLWEAVKTFAIGILDDIIGYVGTLIEKVQSAINKLLEFIGVKDSAEKKAMMATPQGKAMQKSISTVSNFLTGKNAKGGMVKAGQTTLVGENGAEYFVPDVKGSIIPNSKLGGGGGDTIVISGNTLLSENVAVQIGDMIMNRLRLQTKLA